MFFSVCIRPSNDTFKCVFQVNSVADAEQGCFLWRCLKSKTVIDLKRKSIEEMF